MYKKLDNFGLNHDEKILNRVRDESKRLSQSHIPVTILKTAEATATTEYQVDIEKMHDIAKGDKLDQPVEEADDFIKDMNKLLKKREDAAHLKTQNINDKELQNYQESEYLHL